MARRIGLVLALLAVGCGESSSPSSPVDVTDASTDTTLPEASPPDVAQETEAEAGPPPVCGTGNRPLPSGLVEIAHDDGNAATNLRVQDFTITVNDNPYVLNETPLYEAVRFELDHPARIHGFSVQWAGLPDAAPDALELAAGLYGDFGYNGFDFWAPEPLWSGTRCAKDATPGQWVDYVFDKPIDLPHPGLVYVAHRADPGSAVFPFDSTTTGTGECALWNDCHSAMNLPEAEASSFFNGVSFSFQYDYLVRLHVEYTDQLAPEQRIFQPQAFDAKSRVSFGDYDDDGYDDMICEGPALYRNRGDGTFEDATASSGIAAMGLSQTGGVWGDFDNDGCLDLFLYSESYTAADALLRSSCNGTFTDVTADSGIVDHQTYQNCGDPNNTRSPTAAAAWVDLDADGLLDLYLANFICWDKETYYSDTVFHNLGAGKFESWSGLHGFSTAKQPSRGVNPIDHDGDGDMDVFVNTYRLKANLFFENQGAGTFAEKAKLLGLAGELSGVSYFGHTIGAAWGDLDGDGDFDMLAANLAHPRFFDISDKTQVLMHQPSHLYQDLAGDWQKPVSLAGIRYQETHSVPVLADFDHDGALDLAITAVYDGRPTDFYWGNGDGTFRLDAYHAGITTRNGWGIATSDFDNDGDPDLFAHQPFVNTKAPSDDRRWLQVRVVGNAGSNHAAIGAVVRVVAAGRTLVRQVQGGTGQGNQDSMYLHFGLRDAASVESISVAFPGGKKVDFAGPIAANQRLWLREDGTSAAGWEKP